MYRFFHLKRSRFIILGILLALCLTAIVTSLSLNAALQPQSHQEWAEIPQGNRILHAYVAYPETQGQSPAVVVIHENRGLTDWVIQVTDRLADEGYLAIAPDLLSGMAPNGGRTVDFANEDAARNALNQLPQPQVMADLQAAADYVKALEENNGQIVVAGFCWGGTQAFEFATERSDLSATFVFYGTPVGDANRIAQINAPVYGFYGGNDSRVSSTVAGTQAAMQAAGKTFVPEIYSDAGHAFMRTGEEAGASAVNVTAMEQSWVRWLNLLQTLNTKVENPLDH